MRLEQRDAEAILGFLAEVEAVDDEPYSADFLRRLARLIPCDEAQFSVVDLRARQWFAVSDHGSGEPEPVDELYWTVGPCPLTDYRFRTGDLTAARLSDLVSRQRLHELPIYREYFRPSRAEHFLEIGLSLQGRILSSVLLIRETDLADFSERDRDVLESLRPHFRARESRSELRRQVRDAAGANATVANGAGAPEQGLPLPEGRLTTREREIVFLAASGRTNAEIAAELWVTPGTVKKHLEHVYEKLGVRSRAAAASHLRETVAAG